MADATESDIPDAILLPSRARHLGDLNDPLRAFGPVLHSDTVHVRPGLNQQVLVTPGPDAPGVVEGGAAQYTWRHGPNGTMHGVLIDSSRCVGAVAERSEADRKVNLARGRR